MLKHPDQEVQFLVEMLEGQRDQAVAQAAALFRANKQLEAKVQELENAAAKKLDEQCDHGEQPGLTD
jgi:hypothetical protein